MHNNEWQQPGSTLVMILGSCAAGKTTLTRALCGEGHTEHTAEFECYDRRLKAYVPERAKYVLTKSGIAIAGNWKNTSDAISKPEALKKVVNLCFGLAPIVIVDSFRPSKKIVDWIQRRPIVLGAVFVCLDIALETALARCLKRRKTNGLIAEQIPDKTYATLLRTRDRAAGVWEYARHNYWREPKAFMKITDHLTPEESANLIRTEIRRVELHFTLKR